MASFTDQLVAFNPYIPQIPVDDYVRVGMAKQQQYNEGVQKTQAYIDSVAGLDVIKPEQKEYLQQRVGQLQGEVSKVVSQDFSNQQIVNSVGNLTSKIAGDPIVQNSVLSTQRYRAGLAAMKEAQEKGQNSPSNEFVFQQSVQRWLGDGDAKSTFTGEYEKYTDTKKPILDAINALKPNANITDIPYQTDENGNLILDKHGNRQIAYATLREKMEGVSEARITQAIEAAITPQIKRQFEIDGQYQYRNLDKPALKRVTEESYNDRLGKINDIIQGLTTQLNTNQDNDDKKQSIQRQIEAYKLHAKDLISQYKTDVETLDQNPDYYKGALHTQDEIAKYSLGYSWAKHSLTYENNPIFNGVMKEKAQELNYDKFREMTMYHQQTLGLKQEELNIRREALTLKYGKGQGSGQFQLDAPTLGVIDQETLESVNISTLTNQVDNMNDQLNQDKLRVIGQLPGGEAWIENRDGKLIYKSAAAKDAAETTLKTMKEAYDKDPSKVSPAAQTFFSNSGNTEAVVKNFQTTADNIMKEADEKYSTSPLTRTVSPLRVEKGGTKYEFSPKELVDLAAKYNNFLNANEPPTSVSPTGVPVRSPIDPNKMNQFIAGLSGKEKDVISTYRSGGDRMIADAFSKAVKAVISPEAQHLAQSRSEFIKEASRRAFTQQQQQVNPIVAYKGADQARAHSNFIQILNDQKAAGKSNSNALFDEGDISKMLDDKNFKNTAYSLHTKADGTYAVRFSNTTVTDRPREIDITPQQAEIWFGTFVNQFKPIQQAIDLSKYKGTGATTDVRGLGKESAYNIPQTGQLNNYSVKYHVEEPYNGQYQVKLYIYDKSAKKWLPETYVDLGGRMLNPQQVTAAVNNLSDAEINRIKKKPAASVRPMQPAVYGGGSSQQYTPDPYIEKGGSEPIQEEEGQPDTSPEDNDEE